MPITPHDPLLDATIVDRVREQYGAAARRVLETTTAAPRSCCTPAPSCCSSDNPVGAVDPITRDLYVQGETSTLPEAAVLASLGCGNPTALAALHPGQIVLDLGAGGGIDVLLSARRVGPTGFAYGLDMTEDMLTLSRQNAAAAKLTNVEFLHGHIEAIPLPAASVDVIISNCVVNLSADKRRVLAEAFRVLKPGGRLAVSDVVMRDAVPAEVRQSLSLWVSCIAGALDEREFRTLLDAQGFTAVDIEPTRVYQMDDARQFLEQAGLAVDAHLEAMDGRIMAAFVRAVKPTTATTAATPHPSPRPATAGDLPAIEQLLTVSALPLDGVAALIARHAPDFVVIDDPLRPGALIGVAGLEPCDTHTALLRSVAIAPAWRGRGVGAQLIAQVRASAAARGMRDLWLLTLTAERFFTREGFRVVPRAEVPPAITDTGEFRHVCPSSAIVMHAQP